MLRRTVPQVSTGSVCWGSGVSNWSSRKTLCICRIERITCRVAIFAADSDIADHTGGLEVTRLSGQAAAEWSACRRIDASSLNRPLACMVSKAVAHDAPDFECVTFYDIP